MSDALSDVLNSSAGCFMLATRASGVELALLLCKGLRRQGATSFVPIRSIGPLAWRTPSSEKMLAKYIFEAPDIHVGNTRRLLAAWLILRLRRGVCGHNSSSLVHAGR